MKLHIFENAEELGRHASGEAARLIRAGIEERGKARIVLSTGASQFQFFEHFVQEDLDWSKVEMFHLDEYVGLSEEHPASFRKYLKDRFVGRLKTPLGKAHWVGEEPIHQLNEAVSKDEIDVALIGIGENSHIAFNDPPADFQTEEPYILVYLDEACKAQQVREGWFGSLEEVPPQAITMSVKQILKSRHILSVVPHQVKARAVRLALQSEVTPNIPASILKTHPNWQLYLDKASASELELAQRK